MSNVDLIKKLREQTGVSLAECRAALERSGGDLDKAVTELRSKAGAMAAKKSGRALGAGTIGTYLHNNRQCGALVELAAETDFVARNPEFVQLAEGLAMHVAGFKPGSREEFLEQPYLLESSRTVAQMVTEASQKFGERVEVVRYSTLTVGQDD